MLEIFGVSPNTEARLDLFARVMPPETRDGFTDPKPVTVTLTVGQVMTLRGGLRHVMTALLDRMAHAEKVSQVTGIPVHAMIDTENADVLLREVLDAEDGLAEAWARGQDIKVEIPDSMPF